MSLVKLGLFALAGSFYASVLHANDGWGGLSTAGLFFTQTDAVAMEKEELYISPSKISVDYVFRNVSDKDVTGEVIFPLPPINMADPYHSSFVIGPEVDMLNPIGFTATVNGAAVPLSLDMRAVFRGTQDRDYEAEANPQYELKGEDVTDLLRNHNIPLSLDVGKVEEALNALSADQKKIFADKGLASWDESDGESEYAFGNWDLALRYHWTQTFAAGQTFAVSHGYNNLASGGLFGWDHENRKEHHAEFIKDYCVDDATSSAMGKLAKAAIKADTISTYQVVSYILKTANSWAGPIKDFKLTIDKGNESTIISLCADGVKKVSPTIFEIVKTNFTPERDLDILFMHKYAE